MDLNYPPEVEDYRGTVAAFLADKLPQPWKGYGAIPEADRQAFLVDWRATLVAEGMLVPHWPVDNGGAGLSVLEQSVMIEEFARVGVPTLPHPNDPFGVNLLGPTLLAVGNDDQRSRFLRPTVTGEIRWAQGFSEPDAGSDLFALRTRGRVEGDELIIDGQKCWQSAGLTANWMFTMVRTDPSQSRHKGLSFVLVPLDQPGVDVRGIRTLTGEAEFAEVFLDGARAQLADVVGGLGAGASVALTLLGLERGAGGVASAVGLANELDRLATLVRERGLEHDTEIRGRLARCATEVHAIHSIALRTLVSAHAGEAIGEESSLTKMMVAEYHQRATELALDILGSEVLVPSGAGPAEWLRPQPPGLDPLSSNAWVADFLHARAGTIYGGSSEIQRNTISERILRMPREVRPAAKGSGS
jgi:alkylation response protein AidB-like acyl-CoA dehydrogenase